jgi:hypothetical protein
VLNEPTTETLRPLLLGIDIRYRSAVVIRTRILDRCNLMTLCIFFPIYIRRVVWAAQAGPALNLFYLLMA